MNQRTRKKTEKLKLSRIENSDYVLNLLHYIGYYNVSMFAYKFEIL